jgi:hypothetical protein
VKELPDTKSLLIVIVVDRDDCVESAFLSEEGLHDILGAALGLPVEPPTDEEELQ